jgi:ABC-type bacteriocin/lantibiotic exporter with double-glycine peptidase domain
VGTNRDMQFRWFARQLRPLLGAHAVSMTLIVLSSLMYLLDPLLIKWLIDRILPKKDFHLLLLAVAGFFGIYICRLGLSAMAGLVSFRTVQALVFRIRLGILEQMNRLSADFHETVPTGEKLYRLEQDVDQVAELGSSLVPYALQTAFNAAFVIVTMFVLNFKLTCMVLPLVPIFFVLRKYFERRLREASDSAQGQSSKESSFLQEHLAAVVQIQLLHQ